MMKDGVIIINTSRGEVIDTRALLRRSMMVRWLPRLLTCLSMSA